MKPSLSSMMLAVLWFAVAAISGKWLAYLAATCFLVAAAISFYIEHNEQ